MDDKKRAVQLAAIMAAKKKGVTAIKVELEAQLARRNHQRQDIALEEGMRRCSCSAEGTVRCEGCDGQGESRCHSCQGNGMVNSASCTNCGGAGWLRCQVEECEGSGYVTHDVCGGTSQIPISSDDPYENLEWNREYICYEWLMRRIAKKEGMSDEDIARRFPYGNGYEYGVDQFPWLKFAKFYNDGSVDSELTFTVKLDNPENVLKVLTVIEAFNEMAKAMGATVNVKGAGMHTAFLWSQDATYPSNHDDYTREQYTDSNRLDEESLKNYKKAVTQLLPALYLLGTTNERSRGLNYRTPRVVVDYRAEGRSVDAKYCAITYRQGAMEFRLFDTCYDNVPAFMDNVVVMCNTLRYLSKKYISPGIAGKVPQRYRFGNELGDKVERFYVNLHHLEALNRGLERIKPSYYTIKEIKKARNFTKDKRALAKAEVERKKRVMAEFKEYTERFNWDLKVRKLRAEAQYTEEIIRNKRGSLIGQVSDAEVTQEVQEKVIQYETEYSSRRKTEAKYVSDRMADIARQEVGQHIIHMTV